MFSVEMSLKTFAGFMIFIPKTLAVKNNEKAFLDLRKNREQLKKYIHFLQKTEFEYQNIEKLQNLVENTQNVA